MKKPQESQPEVFKSQLTEDKLLSEGDNPWSNNDNALVHFDT